MDLQTNVANSSYDQVNLPVDITSFIPTIEFNRYLEALTCSIREDCCIGDGCCIDTEGLVEYSNLPSMATPLRDEKHPKRLKLEGRDHDEEIECATDCFDEVTVHGNMDGEGFLHHSWIRRQDWFSDFQQKTKTKMKLERSSEITALQIQLTQIKRRLLPTAKAVANAINLNHVCVDPVHNDVLSPERVFQIARRCCNPFEILGEGRAGGLNNLFVNRSAIKLANINSCIGFVVTHAAQRGTFNFVDLCAAPGGFSEYLFYHCKRSNPSLNDICGIGMSLIGTNEHGQGTNWKLDNFDWQGMHYRVCTGADGTGDIYNWDNVVALKDSLNGMKIDAVVCDGGVDAQRDHEHQEQLSQKLVISQVAAALSVVSPGGNVLIKLFGFQTESIRAMMKDLARRFRDFVITKPISSRPASAERFLVLYGFQPISPEFDGRKWRDSVFLGASNHFSKGEDTKKLDTQIDFFLDLFDRDMLRLNIKACFAILSKMERMVLTSGDNEEETCPVDILSYRRAWRI